MTKTILLFFISVSFYSVAQENLLLTKTLIPQTSAENNPFSLSDLALYEDYIYYSVNGNRIYRINISDDSSVPEILFDGEINVSTGMFIENGILYILDSHDGNFGFDTGKLYKANLNLTTPTLELVIDSLSFPLEISSHNNIIFITENYLNNELFFESSSISMIDTSFQTPSKSFIYETTDKEITDIEYINGDLIFHEFSVENTNKRIGKINISTEEVSSVYVYDNEDYAHVKGFVVNNTLYMNNTNTFTTDRGLYNLDLSLQSPSTSLVDFSPIYGSNDYEVFVSEIVVSPQNILYMLGDVIIIDPSSPESFPEYVGLLYSLDLNSLDIEEYTFNQKLKIFPNPTSDVLRIENLDVEIDYDIIDISGKILKSGKLGPNINQLDISNFENAIYFLRLDKFNVLKFIKKA